MEKTNLTVRVPRDLLEGAKRYASDHQTLLTRLISEYLRQLTTKSDPLPNAPIVQRLSGTLSQDVSVQDYEVYVEQKYGDETWSFDRSRRRSRHAPATGAVLRHVRSRPCLTLRPVQ